MNPASSSKDVAAAVVPDAGERPCKLRRMSKHIDSSSGDEYQPFTAEELLKFAQLGKNSMNDGTDSADEGIKDSSSVANKGDHSQKAHGNEGNGDDSTNAGPPTTSHSDDEGDSVPPSPSDVGPVQCSIRVQRMVTVLVQGRFAGRYFFQHSFSGAATPRAPTAPFWG